MLYFTILCRLFRRSYLLRPFLLLLLLLVVGLDDNQLDVGNWQL